MSARAAVMAITMLLVLASMLTQARRTQQRDLEAKAAGACEAHGGFARIVPFAEQRAHLVLCQDRAVQWIQA